MLAKKNEMEKTNMDLVVGDNQTGEKLTVEHKKPKRTKGENIDFKVEIGPYEQLKPIIKENVKLKMEMEMRKKWFHITQ